MAQIVKLKRTAVSGKIPTTSNLELGELALNTYDGRIFFEKSSSVESIQEILTTNSSPHPITGSLYLNGAITASYFKGDGSGLTNLPINIGIEEATTVTASFENVDDITVTHNFDSYNILVQVFDSNRNLLIPSNVSLPTLNTARVTLSGLSAGYVVVAKGGHLISGSLTADDASALNGQPGSYYLDWDNFNNIPNGIISSSAQIDTLFDIDGLVSTSAQVIGHLDGSGIVSGSTQLDNTTIDGLTITAGEFTGSIKATSHIIPDTNVAYDLGSSTHRFRDLYLSNNSIFFEIGTISVNTGSGFFELKDANDDPAIIKTETFVLSPSGSTTQTFISAGVQGGVKFLSISDTQMVTYSIDNYDLQNSVTFSYIDSSGNPQSVTVSANTNNYELDAQEGSVTRTSGTDRYRIKLLRVPNDTPTAQIEVASLVVTGSNGGINITISNSGSVEIKNQDDTPANIDAGSITISGSQGHTTLSNELSGGLAVINDAGELQPIRVNQIEIVDSTTGNVINLTSVSGSLTTTATNSSGSTIEPPKSNLSGSFTGSLTLTGDIVSTVDCVKVGTSANPICEIHGTDIFGTINAINGVISGSSQITNLTTYKEDVSGNSTYTITHNLNEEYPIVQAWNTTTKRQEIPSIVESTSVNVLNITFAGTFSGRIIVKK